MKIATRAREAIGRQRFEKPRFCEMEALTSLCQDQAAPLDRLSDKRVDVLMVGSSRLGQPRRIFLGTTAAKMLRALAVPMIVVPREETTEIADG